jgi:mRNA interferase MazF
MMTMTLSKPDYRRGEIVLVLYPNSDLVTFKRRPALIIQANNLNTDIPQVVVAMLTSNLHRANHPSHVLVELSGSVGKSTGLLADSVVMTDNLATIHNIAIERAIGALPMEDVDIALRHTLGL